MNGTTYSRGRARVSASDQRRFIAAFGAAAETGDLPTLEELLATDVARHSDRGRVREAARIPMIGRAYLRGSQSLSRHRGGRDDDRHVGRTAPLGSLVRRVLLAMLEERRTRRPGSAPE